MALEKSKSKTGQKFHFPSGFLWGSATSSHQVEGDNINNDWWSAEQQGLVSFKSLKAADHYNRFREDFDIAKQLNQNAHRLSIEWSRVEPEKGSWNEQAIEHYRAVLEALRERKMQTFVTLHHFANPLWFSGEGGWANKKSPELFARYCEFIAKRLGGLIDFYVTINEPLVYMALGYQQGLWPPFEKNSYGQIIKVFKKMVAAHKAAYKVIKQVDLGAKVGIAANLIDFQPRQKWNPIDRLLNAGAEYSWNHLFLNKIADTMDFIGVNYYFHHHIHATNIFRHVTEHHSSTDLGWGIHPEGLYFVIGEIMRYKKPVYITENGVADETDTKREEFILQHLEYIAKAMQEGADVRGYFYWSLLDNFEWEKGFAPRFGLVSVDYKNMERTIRPSAYFYADICKSNSVSIWPISYIK